MKSFLFLFLIFSASVSNSQENGNLTVDAALCLPMISQVVTVGVEGGPTSYKLPVFNEAIDAKCTEFLKVAMNKRSELKPGEYEKMTADLYSEIKSIAPELAKACNEFSTFVIGDCFSQKNSDGCFNKRATSPEASDASKKFAITARDLLLKKTEMKTAVDLLVNLDEKKKAVESKFNEHLAQFVADHYIKILLIVMSIPVIILIIAIRAHTKKRKK